MIYRSLFGGPNYDFEKVLEMLNYERPTYKTTKITTQGADAHEINYTKDGAYLFFEAPGFNKTTLKVEVENGIIHIQGSRTYKLNGEEKTTGSRQQAADSERRVSKQRVWVKNGRRALRSNRHAS